MEDNTQTPLPKKEELQTIFFNNFNNKELSLIISAINKTIPKEERKKLVLARTTETSMKMTVEEWIDDTADDHLYLLENPPTKEQKVLVNAPAKNANEQNEL